MFEIKFGTPLHKRVLEALEARRKLAEASVSKNLKKWDRADEICKAYAKPGELDVVRNDQRKAGIPAYTTIQIPYSYAQLLSAHTYVCSVMLARSPVHQIRGNHGEAEQNTLAVEALIDYQVRIGEMQVPYYVWYWDALKYGVGIISEYWCKEVHTIAEFEEVPVVIDGRPTGKMEMQRVLREVPAYEGMKIFNVRPHDFLPDPRVPISQTQKGEFVGRKMELLWVAFAKGLNAGRYFNKAPARDVFDKKSQERRHTNKVNDLPNPEYSGNSDATLLHAVQGYELEVELIPSMWGLGSSDAPEKWCFTVLDDKVIVEATPLGLEHNKFSYSVLESEIEGYDFTKRGMVEIGEPLNNVLDWLVNSHFYNVRKTLNGEIVYDPSAVYASDVLDPQPGRRIKMKPEAYGRDVRTVFHNISLGGDITQNHISDTGYIGTMMQRLLGVSDNTIGVPQQGGRRSATESRIASAGSTGRLKTITEYMSALGVSPHAGKLIQTTQQKYTGEKAFRIAGDAMYNGKPELIIRPQDLAGNYDYVPVDGSIPFDRYAIVSMWGNLFAQIRNLPQVMQSYDMGRVFEWVAQQGGIRNIRQFKIQVQDPGAGAIPLDGGQPRGVGRGAQVASMGAEKAVPIPLSAPGMDRLV